MNNDDYILRCTGLTKTYDEANFSVEVLKGVYLRIAPGEQVAIVGASGAGKSTLLHLLGGLETPTSGLVELNGDRFSEMGEAKRGHIRNQKMGFVYQFHHLLPEFTALENVAMPLLIRRMSNEQALAEAREMLTRVGLEDRLQHKPSELSGGERQRVAVARALVTRPVCILADEPTGNLDTKTGAEVFNLFKSLHDQGRTVVVITHDTHIADQVPRTIRISDGRIVEDSTACT